MTQNGHHLLRLSPCLKPYDWGSYDALPAFLGIEPTGEAVAEAWFGTHPSGPSQVAGDEGGSGDLSLAQVTAGDPAFWFGAGNRDMSFLLKVLAIGRPLSLQMHPTLLEAKRGFDEENRRGIPVSDPTRVFRDANHKPELICALTEIDALCGFRPTADSIELLALLGGRIGEGFVHALNAGVSIKTLVRRSLSPADELLGATIAARSAAIAELVECADRVVSRGCPEKYRLAATWIARLGRQYPTDGGVAVAALLNCVRLNKGEALFLDAGNMHAYLRGLGVEIMANSDNVIRAGMTSKHIDVDVLTRLVDTDPIAEPVIVPRRVTLTGGAEWETWVVPVPDFSLSRLTVESGSPEVLPYARGIRVALCSEGSVTVTGSGSTVVLRKGEALVSPASAVLTVSGHGEAFFASPG